jgi:DNA replication protein DnaC
MAASSTLAALPVEPVAQNPTIPPACRDRHIVAFRALLKEVEAEASQEALAGDLEAATSEHGDGQVLPFSTGVYTFKTQDELVERDMLEAGVAEFLRACVGVRLSIVFAGAPGSGKTTLLSCCTAEIDPSLRVVVAEEVFEADVPLPPNVAHTWPSWPRLGAMPHFESG